MRALAVPAVRSAGHPHADDSRIDLNVFPFRNECFLLEEKNIVGFLYCVQRRVDEVDADLLLEDLNAFYQARTARWNKAK